MVKRCALMLSALVALPLGCRDDDGDASGTMAGSEGGDSEGDGDTGDDPAEQALEPAQVSDPGQSRPPRPSADPSRARRGHR